MPRPRDLSALPDTPLVNEARVVVAAALSPGVFHHSMRTFALGRAYADRKEISFDPEDLALASLFHDLGISAEFAQPGKPFTYASARALRLFLEERGGVPARVDPLVDAIALHMQLWPRWSAGPVAGLLQVGAWMDVTALRRWTVWDDAGAIAALHPRHGFDLEFAKSLVGQAWPPSKLFRLFVPGEKRG